jgi:hypothetical protein
MISPLGESRPQYYVLPKDNPKRATDILRMAADLDLRGDLDAGCAPEADMSALEHQAAPAVSKRACRRRSRD